MNACMTPWIFRLAVVAVIAGAAPRPVLGDDAPTAPASGVRFFPDVAGMGKLGFFANQQDELQDVRYVTEWAMAFDFGAVSFGERWALRTRVELLANLGTSVAQNLPFSPNETTYRFSPYGEYRRGAWLARFGWEHACQHLTYKDYDDPWYVIEGSNVPPDVYYNRIFAGAGHREIRPELLRQSAFREGVRPPRVFGYIEAGGYLRSLPGMDEESLHDGNDWVADLRADVHLLLLARPRWLLLASSHAHAWLDTDDELHMRERVQVEAVFDSRGFGISVYAGWTPLDEHPRDSMEDLVDLGARFYF
jgi:hypothetical protein